MAKDQPRPTSDLSSASGLADFGRKLIEAESILKQAAVLRTNIAVLERRKKDLSAEVAPLLEQIERHRQDAAVARAAAESEQARFQSLRQAEQEGLHQDRAARAAAEASESKSIKERAQTIATALREEKERLQAEITSLREQKAALLKDLDETLTKYARR